MDDYTCSGLCLHFLDILSSDVRKETSDLVHDLCRTDVEDESAKERCTNAVVKIEREVGADHFLCELVIKVLAELLRKICMLDSAIELITEHMERKNSEDIGSLLLCARIYGLFGDYRKGIQPMKKAVHLAEQSGEPLYVCLVLVKEACNIWHLKNPEKAKEKLVLCEQTLEESNFAEKYNTFPFSELTHRLIDLYKTLGYMYYTFHDPAKSVEYYLKAFEILEKDTKSITQMIKLESVIAQRYSWAVKGKTRIHGLNVFQRIKQVSENETYMIHHPLPMMHSLQRVARSMDMCNFQADALDMYEYVYAIGEKYMDQNHPEVARLAAGAALLCNRMNETAKEDLYAERSIAALEHGSIDLSHIKLHVREISDAWYLLGQLYANKNNFEQSERCFKEAVSVNTRVYGCSHPRLTKLYNSLGYLYKKNSKFPAALDSFRKCKEINEEFNSGDAKILGRLTDQIEKIKALQKKYKFRRTD